MFESRRNFRYASSARAIIEGLHEGEALLRDISVTGCRLEFSAAIAFGPNQAFWITVYPEMKADISAFEIEATPVWSRADYDSFEVGFNILASPRGKAFLRYVDYLAWVAGGKATGDAD
jgi:hypothetical protein